MALPLSRVGTPGPDYSLGGLADLFGELEDLQRPLLLRAHPAFRVQARKQVGELADHVPQRQVRRICMQRALLEGAAK
ncbi:hypothetical protein EASAB2608_08317 [Streptomyces sp. EAS-AB2608]|nr:hypothetical protein EASAB2608_08317 [Streptomyces sp. EAS-AB2608]